MSTYPISKYQQVLLDKLGLSAFDSAEAIAHFHALGLVVSSKRVGKTVVPVVSILPRHSTTTAGGWNPGREDGWGETVTVDYPDFDFSKIVEFEVK